MGKAFRVVGMMVRSEHSYLKVESYFMPLMMLTTME